MPVEIRRAVIEDATSIADVHVRSWNGARPAGFDSLPVDVRLAEWEERLAEGAVAVFVACDGVEVNGMVSAGDGEVGHLYVLPESWGSGVADRLLETALDELRAAGFDHAALWVLDDNPRARAFYVKQGWTLDDATKVAFTWEGREVIDVRYTRPL